MERDRVEKELREFYEDKSFYNGLLHETCIWRGECWKGIHNGRKSDAKWNSFSLPYIGENYDSRLTVVGLNVNEGGGRYLQKAQIEGGNTLESNEKDDFTDKYIPGVRDSLRKGNKMIKFSKGMRAYGIDYGGTVLWHRVAIYAAIILERYANYSEKLLDDGKTLADTYGKIIYMDAIKCSPAGKNSEPGPVMLENCAANIFFKELEIIKSETLLLLSHHAAEFMQTCSHFPIINGSKDFPGINKDMDYCQMDINGKKTNVFYIIHPTAPGRGNLLTIPDDFAKFVNLKKHK
jgi:hypothetical protein